MKKRLLPIMLLSAFMLIGCGSKTSSSSSVPSDAGTIAISNKDELTAQWRAGESPRTLKLTYEPATNITQAILKGDITITSSDTSVISTNGLNINALKAGTATVTANYVAHPATDSVTITVLDAATEPEVIKGKTCAEVTELGAKALNTVLYEVKGTVESFGTKDSWNQYGEFKVTDSSKGTVYFYGSYVNTTDEPASFVFDGEVYKVTYTNRNVLTADLTKDLKVGDEVTMLAMHDAKHDNFYGIFQSVTPAPYIEPTSVSLDKDTLTLNAGEEATLVATVLPEDCNRPVKWTSSDEKIATVSSTGKVVALAEGTVTITVTVGSLSKTCTLTVEKANEKLVNLTVSTLALASSAYADGTATVNKVNFEYVELGNYGNGIQMRHASKSSNEKTSSLWNKSAFATAIDSIDLTYVASKINNSNEKYLKVEFSSTSDFASAETQYVDTVAKQTDYKVTPVMDNALFVRFTHNSTYAAYWDAIAINLK